MLQQIAIETRVSKFQVNNVKSQNNPSRPYEDEIKKRLNKRQFSTYKIYDLKVNGIGLVGQTRYVQYDYWQDYYTAVYQPMGTPYPTPPAEP